MSEHSQLRRWEDFGVIEDALSQLAYGLPVGDQARCVACLAFWREAVTEHEEGCYIGAAEECLRAYGNLLALMTEDTTAADLRQEVEFLKAELAQTRGVTLP